IQLHLITHRRFLRHSPEVYPRGFTCLARSVKVCSGPAIWRLSLAIGVPNASPGKQLHCSSYTASSRPIAFGRGIGRQPCVLLKTGATSHHHCLPCPSSAALAGCPPARRRVAHDIVSMGTIGAVPTPPLTHTYRQHRCMAVN